MIADFGIRFILNHEDVNVADSPGLLVLDFLRRRRRMIGTKEGCKEGDCGACCVLIGEVTELGLTYKPVTSCLLPLAEVEGRHLVTIEGLNADHALSPIQHAVVREGGSQCGYCTPGIIVSLTHCIMEKRGAMTLDDIKVALSGNLCRCTGYASLVRAASGMSAQWSEPECRTDDGSLEHQLPLLVAKGFLPDYFLAMPERMRALQATCSVDKETEPGTHAEFRIAGGTDLYVQRGEEIPDARVDLLNVYPGMDKIVLDGDRLQVGALTTFEAISKDPHFRQLVPRIDAFMHVMASLQIRNRATLAGNVVNASPIGDMTMLLLALEASVTFQGDCGSRTLALRDLYRGYKDLDMQSSEILLHFTIPVPAGEAYVHFEKVSKRKCLDIASVNSAIKLVLDDGCILEAALALGGVAPVPKYLPESTAFLVGKPVDAALVAGLLPVVQREIAPISDVRGSAEYKRLLARQLVLSHFLTLFPTRVLAESFM